MTRSTRQLTESEKRAISSLAKAPSYYLEWTLYGLFGWMITVSLAGAIGHLLERWFLKPLGSPLLLLFITLVWIAVIIYQGRSSTLRYTWRPSKWRELCEQDLAGGVTYLLTYSATDAIRVEEFEDEGSQYFVHLKDGSVLFLVGQYLYDDEENKKFPCTEFSVIQTPHTKMVFGVICQGTYFPPSKELKPFRPEMFEKNEVPEDGSIVQIPWSEIEAKYS